MTPKEKLEMMNLRNRVRAQREEIKRLQAALDEERSRHEEIEELFPETLEDLEKMLNAVGVRQ